MVWNLIGSDVMKAIVLLSGPIAVGKSSIAVALQDHHGFSRISSSGYLKGLAAKQGLGNERPILQRLGDDLDVLTDYRWLIDEVAKSTIQSRPEVSRWLLDSVRKQRQVEHFREQFGASVLHVHLTAPEDILRQRYESRAASAGNNQEATPYELAIGHPNEIAARQLIRIADHVADLTLATPEKVAIKIQELLDKRSA